MQLIILHENILACDSGEYGAGCRQKRQCFCQDGSGCDPFTGKCASGICEEGYIRQPFCDVGKLMGSDGLYKGVILNVHHETTTLNISIIHSNTYTSEQKKGGGAM